MKPRVRLTEAYTDNLRLAPPGREESDFVTETAPGVSIRGVGSRLRFDADYEFQYRLYAKADEGHGHNHLLHSHGLLDVWDRHLFLDAAANITQQNFTPLGTQSETNLNITGNRNDVRYWSLSPYWVSRLGHWGNLDARYSWRRADYSGNAASTLDTTWQTAKVAVTSGDYFTDFQWGLNYTKDHIESTGSSFPDRNLESYSGNVRYRIHPTFALTGQLGYEDNTYGTTRGDLSGTFWNVGFDWAPSIRTRVTASAGERYFGNTYALKAEHRTRLTTWALSYSEEIIATPSRFTVPGAFSTVDVLDRLLIGTFPDATERLEAANALLVTLGLPPELASSVDFLSTQVTLSKRWLGSFGLRGTRATLLAHVFQDKRSTENKGVASSILGTNPFSDLRSVDQTGIAATLSWRFSERTTGSIYQSYTKSKYVEAGQDDTVLRLRLGVTHQLQPKLYGSLSYHFTDRDSSVTTNYRENAVLGSLTLTF